MNKSPVSLLAAALVAASASLFAGCAGPVNTVPAGDKVIHLVALNDFHGNLEAEQVHLQAAPASRLKKPSGRRHRQPGGALDAYRREDPDLLFVAAGDLVGASPAHVVDVGRRAEHRRR